MLLLIFKTLYFLLPAFLGNMAPVIAARLGLLPRLAKPIDNGVKFRGQPLLGKSKTWRGIVVGVSTAMFVGIIQFFLWEYDVIRIHSIVNFDIVDPISLGFIGGIGALGGDMVKSAIKRQFKIPSGNPWPVFDQLDFIFGYLVMTSFFVGFMPDVFITALLATLILHPLVNIIAYILRIKKVWW